MDALYERFDRSLHEPRHGGRRQRGFEPGRKTNNSAKGGPTVGRYSREPLQEQAQYDGQSARRHSRPPHRHASSTRPDTPTQHSQELIEGLAAPHGNDRKVTASDPAYRASPLATADQATEDAVSLAASLKDKRGTSQNSDRYFSNTSLTPQTQGVLPHRVCEAAARFMQSPTYLAKWNHLQDTVRQAGSISSLRTLGKDRYFNRALFYFIVNRTSAFVAAPDSAESNIPERDLPVPSILLQIRSATTEDASTVWPLALWNLAKYVASLKLKGDSASQDLADQGLDELMTIWSLCMKAQSHKGRSSSQVDSVEDLLSRPTADFTFLPNTIRFRDSLQARGKVFDLVEILNFLVPSLAISSQQRDFDFASAAIVTLDLLQNWKRPINRSYEGWITMMEMVMQCRADNKVPRALARTARGAEDDQIKEYYSGVIRNSCKQSPQTPSTKVASTPTNETVPETVLDEKISNEKRALLQSLEPPPALTESSSDFDRFAVDAVKNLGRALEQNKPVYAQRTWQNIQENAAKYPGIPTPLHLYERLLLTFIAMRDQQHPVEIWTAMLKDGHRPTVKTYSIVMQGCRYIGDAKTLEAFWASMRKAGLQPDSHAWSTRVYALLKRREIDAGLRCLAEMSQDWIAAARQVHERELPIETKRKKKAAEQMTSAQLAIRYANDINGVPRPNLIVMNAAVSALAAVSDQDISKVLSWARGFGIDPDLTTYNTLLNVTMRHNQPDEALQILRRMESQGIQADGTTWTVLLTALFEGGFLDDLSPAAQQEHILSFIASLEAINAAHIDLKGYALIIDRLLKHHANMPAADAVLRHMTSKKIQPTPHIYTILMTAYFNPPDPPNSPPNFPAIESLWNSLRTANAGHGTPLDAQFYDRMVEGYATHHVAYGSTKPVHLFLQRMRNEGKTPSWKALTCAVRAFAARGEWERAGGLVARVRRDVEGGGRQVGMRFGQREFWGLVGEMGLLDLDAGEVPGTQEREERGRR